MKRYIRATRIGKEKEVYVTQEYTGYGKSGWEDIAVYDDTSPQSHKEAKDEVKSYRDNGFSARIITRRIPNPNYVEPDHNITVEEVHNYINNECPYPVEELYPAGANYKLGKYYPGCQILINDDNTVGIYNIDTKRTKTVYTLPDMVKTIDKIMQKR